MRNALCVAVVALPLACLAADNYTPMNVKPGLWETKVTTELPNLPQIPDEALAKMTPEQRERVEAAVKAQQSRGPQTNTEKSCLTAEQLAKPLMFQQVKSNCKYDLVRSTRSQQEIHIACTGPNDLKSEGVIKLEAVDSENVKGSSQFTTTMNRANSTLLKASFTSHRVSGDCGSVKPNQ